MSKQDTDHLCLCASSNSAKWKHTKSLIKTTRRLNSIIVTDSCSEATIIINHPTVCVLSLISFQIHPSISGQLFHLSVPDPPFLRTTTHPGMKFTQPGRASGFSTGERSGLQAGRPAETLEYLTPSGPLRFQRRPSVSHHDNRKTTEEEEGAR